MYSAPRNSLQEKLGQIDYERTLTYTVPIREKTDAVRCPQWLGDKLSKVLLPTCQVYIVCVKLMVLRMLPLP